MSSDGASPLATDVDGPTAKTIADENVGPGTKQHQPIAKAAAPQGTTAPKKPALLHTKNFQNQKLLQPLIPNLGNSIHKVTEILAPKSTNAMFPGK